MLDLILRVVLLLSENVNDEAAAVVAGAFGVLAARPRPADGVGLFRF
jgi:hypothetical protein